MGFSFFHKPIAICVLGMHRSGTSCMTGMLEDAGFYLGNVSKKNPYNLKGNQENSAIMGINDEIMALNGGSWDNPPQSARVDDDMLRRMRALHAREYKGRKRWAFKDPRTMFTLDAWLKVVPSLKFLGTFRNPVSVAKSLENRAPWPREKSLALWRSYNERLMQYQDRYGFALLDFDLPRDEYVRKFSEALEGLGIKPKPHGLAFYDEGLINNKERVDLSELDSESAGIYEALLKRAL